MDDWAIVAAELRKKLHPDAVRQRQQGGTRVSYIEGWHAIAEANRIFGFESWTRETVDLRCVCERERKIGRDQKDGWGVTYIAKVRVSVGGVVREGSGAGHGIGTDLGECHESALKEAETDAMKRALMTFGNPFGLALYDKDRENVGVDEPPFSPAGCLARLLAGIDRHRTRQLLTEYWQAEADARQALKAADPARYDEFYRAFKAAGEKAIDDPARQSPHPDDREAA